MKRTLLTLTILMFLLFSCKTTKETAVSPPVPPLDCTTTQVGFEAVNAIMNDHCVSCHNYGSTSGGYDLSDKATIKRAGANGFLLGTIKHESGFSRMPFHAPKLDQASINKIECWIKNGMKD